MPAWPPPRLDLVDYARELHHSAYGSTETCAGSAPATWTLIGEQVDHIGGVVVAAVSDLRCAVVSSTRDDGTVMVTEYRRDSALDEESHTSSITLEEVAQRAIEQQTEDVLSPRPMGGLAARLGGVAWMLIHRQFLSRDTGGFNITVVSDVPAAVGLGSDVATETAWATALAAHNEHRLDPPTRARLAEICMAAATLFSDTPPVAARYSTTMRGPDTGFAVTDHCDGSVTAAPDINDCAHFLVAAPAELAHDSFVEEQRRREFFARQAARSFGVDNLCRLPDASPRALEWLTAVRKVKGDANFPEEHDAAAWLRFYEEELIRTRAAVAGLRARKSGDVLRAVDASQQGLSATFASNDPARDALAELCRSRGALATRSAAVGLTTAVVAHVGKHHALNFAADLEADGLLVVALQAGHAAESH